MRLTLNNKQVETVWVCTLALTATSKDAEVSKYLDKLDTTKRKNTFGKIGVKKLDYLGHTTIVEETRV